MPKRRCICGGYLKPEQQICRGCERARTRSEAAIRYVRGMVKLVKPRA